MNRLNRVIVPEHNFSNLNQVETLKKVIETSYDLLLGQVGKGRIVIENEASFQLHFAYILKTVYDQAGDALLIRGYVK